MHHLLQVAHEAVQGGLVTSNILWWATRQLFDDGARLSWGQFFGNRGELSLLLYKRPHVLDTAMLFLCVP